MNGGKSSLQLVVAMAELHISVLEELVGRFWLHHRLDFTLQGHFAYLPARLRKG